MKKKSILLTRNDLKELRSHLFTSIFSINFKNNERSISEMIIYNEYERLNFIIEDDVYGDVVDKLIHLCLNVDENQEAVEDVLLQELNIIDTKMSIYSIIESLWKFKGKI